MVLVLRRAGISMAFTCHLSVTFRNIWRRIMAKKESLACPLII
jgi:hypothetical protein